MQTFGASKIEKSFVNGNGLDDWRKLAHYFPNFTANLAVLGDVRPDDDRIGAGLERLEHRLRRMDAVSSGDVTGCRDDTSFPSANDDRLIGQGGIVAFLHGGIEC